MDNQFRIKLAEICARASGDEESRKKALKKCVDFGLSNREEFLLGTIFGPTPDTVLIFLQLYEKYLPYLRGEIKKIPDISEWKDADEVDLTELDLESVDVFGWLLRQAFLWNGQGRYEAAVREIIRKFDAYTNGLFEFDGLLDDDWSDAYYRLLTVIIAENLAFLEKPVQMFFVGTKMFLDAIIFGIDVDEKINQSVDFYVYLSLRFDQSTDTATFLYANEQTMGFNPETGEAVKLSFWIDKFRIYSDKKFDGLSLINFVQDEKEWGEPNDSFIRLIIKNVLMIYGHLVSGFYVYPPAGETSARGENIVPVPTPTTTAPVSAPAKPTIPSRLAIKKTIQDKVSQFSEDDKPAAIINFLSDFSTHYNDPTIADLYYFDEQSGEFKWKE